MFFCVFFFYFNPCFEVTLSHVMLSQSVVSHSSLCGLHFGRMNITINFVLGSSLVGTTTTTLMYMYLHG